MSYQLANDFNMYYNDTYILARMGGVVYPFYVDSVTAVHDEEDMDSKEAFDSLVFNGSLLVGNNSQSVSIRGFNNPDLILENTELGFFIHQGNLAWASYIPSRSTKKGICNRRVSINFMNRGRGRGSRIPFSGAFMKSVCSRVFGDRIITPNYAIDTLNGDDFLYFRGTICGKFNSDKTELLILKSSSFLLNDIMEVLPECQIIIQP